MSGKTIGKSLNHGFAGNFARMPDSVIGTLRIADDSGVIKFGEAVFLTEDGEGSSYRDGFTAAQFVGVASSEVKSAFTLDNADGTYRPGQAASVLKRGAISVLCLEGDAIPGKPVYLRTAKSDAFPDGMVGGFETEEETGKTILIPNAVWVTGQDANGVAELLLRSINLI